MNENDDEEMQLVQPFYVDDGELDGLTPQQVFVLGYEFATVEAELLKGLPFQTRVHSDNEERVKLMLKRKGAAYEFFIHDDWPTLHVMDCGPSSRQ